MSHLVYIYYDPSRGHNPFYVGKAKTLGVAYRHLNGKSHSKTLSGRITSIIEAGLAPGIGIIECTDNELAALVETELIAKYGRANLKLGPLLNLTDGGDGDTGMIVSEETKLKLSLANKGKKRAKRSEEFKRKQSETRRKWLSANNVGPASEETKKKMSAAKIGKSRPEISIALKGKPKPPGFSEKLRQAKLGVKRKEVTCPHCGKTGGDNNMKRWHFDNCRIKFYDLKA